MQENSSFSLNRRISLQQHKLTFLKRKIIMSTNRKDILDILPEVDVDLVYFDPPYATEFSTTNNETSYHFVEGLMTPAFARAGSTGRGLR